MKLKMIWIGKEAPRIEMESETEGDFLVLKSMSELNGFGIVGFAQDGGYLGAGWSPLRNNEKHGTLKLEPWYKPEQP